MVEDITPRESLERALRYWWVIALTMLVGGFIGWSIGCFSAPVYEARADYRVTLDEAVLLAELRKTDPDAELTYELRAPYLTPVALMFYTPEVRSAVKELALEEGLDFPEDGFRSGQLSLDQRRSDWTIIVRHSDSETAAKLANLWSATADEYLQRAHKQAVLAALLKLELDLLPKCFSNTTLADANQCAGTFFADAAEMQTYYQDLDRRYQEALSASDGISTLVNYNRGTAAEPPLRPIYYSTGLLAVVGSLLGLIIGGVLIQRLPMKNN
jgi:hypothetical protein